MKSQFILSKKIMVYNNGQNAILDKMLGVSYLVLLMSVSTQVISTRIRTQPNYKTKINGNKSKYRNTELLDSVAAPRTAAVSIISALSSIFALFLAKKVELYYPKVNYAIYSQLLKFPNTILYLGAFFFGDNLIWVRTSWYFSFFWLV